MMAFDLHGTGSTTSRLAAPPNTSQSQLCNRTVGGPILCPCCSQIQKVLGTLGGSPAPLGIALGCAPTLEPSRLTRTSICPTDLSCCQVAIPTSPSIRNFEAKVKRQFGGHDGSRTHGLWIDNPLLCPTELRDQRGRAGRCSGARFKPAVP